jgi:23S rRNA pseudouridine2605 synthase
MADLSLHRFLKAARRWSVREAERLIREGRVRVDGAVVDRPEARVAPGARIEVDGARVEPAAAEPPAVWLYHKPVGLVCSRSDEQGRRTVYDALPADLGYVFSVGRLDLMSEGALLLTRDGALSRRLADPRFHVAKVYRVKVRGEVRPGLLSRLETGVVPDGVRTRPCRIVAEETEGGATWTRWTLTEGKNRQIRRMAEAAGLTILKLVRVEIGGLGLGTLAAGDLRRLTDAEVAGLLRATEGGEHGSR